MAERGRLGLLAHWHSAALATWRSARVRGARGDQHSTAACAVILRPWRARCDRLGLPLLAYRWLSWRPWRAIGRQVGGNRQAATGCYACRWQRNGDAWQPTAERSATAASGGDGWQSSNRATADGRQAGLPAPTWSPGNRAQWRSVATAGRATGAVIASNRECLFCNATNIRKLFFHRIEYIACVPQNGVVYLWS